MQNQEEQQQQELHSCYASEDELVMTEDIENLLNDWLNEFETQQQGDTNHRLHLHHAI